MSNYFESILSKFQCGFRKGFSAQHCLLVLVEKCRKFIDKGGFNGIFFTDLSKAFDCIDHELLTAKLHAYGFDIDSLRYIYSYLTERIQKRVKINSSYSKWNEVEFGVPQGSILGPLLFNIYICDMFFSGIEIDLANYADDTTPFTCDMQFDKVIESLTTNVEKLFQWFSDNYLKPNPDKCHFLTNYTGNSMINIKQEVIPNSLNQKLLGIEFNNKFCFDDHVSKLCRKASQKLNALSRVAHYMSIEQRRIIMRAFISSQFGYCPLVWLFHSRRLNNRINNIHERALRLVYRDYSRTSFKALLQIDKSVTIHQRNLQVLIIEIFKTKVGINPEIMNEIFIFKKPIYDFRKTDTLKRIKVKSVKFGTESVSYLGPKLWDLLPTEFKNIESLSKFKDKITGWDTDECPCKLCKNYIRDLGFI